MVYSQATHVVTIGHPWENHGQPMGHSHWPLMGPRAAIETLHSMPIGLPSGYSWGTPEVHMGSQVTHGPPMAYPWALPELLQLQ